MTTTARLYKNSLQQRGLQIRLLDFNVRRVDKAQAALLGCLAATLRSHTYACFSMHPITYSFDPRLNHQVALAKAPVDAMR